MRRKLTTEDITWQLDCLPEDTDVRGKFCEPGWYYEDLQDEVLDDLNSQLEEIFRCLD